MKVERYQEDDMRKAMAKVRAELGNDAVLISSRRVDGRTEVTAASNYDPDRLQAELARTSENRGAEQENKEFLFEFVAEESESAVEKLPSLLDMQDELSKLRKLFEGELAQLAWRDVGSREPNRLALLARLETVGISRDIGARIMKKVLPCNDLEIGWHRTLRILSKVIKTPKQDLMEDGGVIALLGPTGVGKTTTAAKIAAQFCLRHGKNQVGFISTDGIRVGGQEQLIALGGTLGIPVQVVRNREELENTLQSFSQRKLVIIDTAGISQRDTGLAKQFESLSINDTEIRPYLVMSATAQESVINETIDAFSSIDIEAAIITKTDENGSIGAILSGLIKNKLPAAFIGNGQRIPEDLLKATAGIFMKKLLSSFIESRSQLRRRRAAIEASKPRAARV